jgi:hypothetical protein
MGQALKHSNASGRDCTSSQRDCIDRSHSTRYRLLMAGSLEAALSDCMIGANHV